MLGSESSSSSTYNLTEDEDSHSPFYWDAKAFIPYIVSKSNWTSSTEPDEILILDFGCGNGFKTKHILLPSIEECLNSNTTRTNQKKIRIFAYDSSENEIERARLNNSHSKITYLTSKEFNELPRRYFDKIFSFRVLHYIQDLE